MSDGVAHALLREGDELVFVVGAARAIVDCSRAVSRVLGVPHVALVGRRFDGLLDTERGVTPGLLERLCREGGVRGELPFAVDGAATVWLELRSARARLGGDDVTLLFATESRSGAAMSADAVELAQLLSQLPGVLWTTDRNLVVTAVTGRGLALQNRTRQELLGITMQEYFGTEEEDFFGIAAHRRALEGHSGRYEFERADHVFHARVDPLRAPDETVVGTVGLALEVPRSGEIEERLRLVQREQTLGRLAGSMAHEFNNLLTIISAHAALLEEHLSSRTGADDLAAVQDAANKGRLLTTRLLAFTMRQIEQPERLRADRLLTELEPMLRSIVGERRTVVLRILPGVYWVRIDPALFEQVILNLVHNAGQATQDGAVIEVSLQAVEGPSGSRVEIAVVDSGVGMNDAMRNRACDPFFTTKRAGASAGLGLTTALAVVTEAGGQLRIDSAPGQGTRVTVALPSTRARSSTAVAKHRGSSSPSPPSTEPGSPSCTESILLVEDQSGVRRAARRILRRAGYKVFEASQAEEALAIATTFPGKLDLLLTAVVMPGRTGPQLASLIVEQRPEICVLYMSGYARDVAEVREALDRGQKFLSKPFRPEQLLRRVRVALGHEDDEGDDAPDVDDGIWR